MQEAGADPRSSYATLREYIELWQLKIAGKSRRTTRQISFRALLLWSALFFLKQQQPRWVTFSFNPSFIFLVVYGIKERLDFWFTSEIDAKKWFQKKTRFRQKHPKLDSCVSSGKAIQGELLLFGVIRHRALARDYCARSIFPRNLIAIKLMLCRRDPMAWRLAQTAIDKGFDKALSFIRAKLLYMPFMHSEVLRNTWRIAVVLFTTVGNV